VSAGTRGGRDAMRRRVGEGGGLKPTESRTVGGGDGRDVRRRSGEKESGGAKTKNRRTRVRV